jgi:hypothetical protein
MADVFLSYAHTVFLSYSRKDHFFAEIAHVKLSEKGIKLWRDTTHLHAGMEWREEIEKNISTAMPCWSQ